VTARKLNWQQPPSAEQIREIVPQTEFDVVSIGVLQALNGADGFDAFDVRLQALDPGPKATIASAFWAVTKALHPPIAGAAIKGSFEGMGKDFTTPV
jgi:hypothetical protein